MDTYIPVSLCFPFSLRKSDKVNQMLELLYRLSRILEQFSLRSMVRRRLMRRGLPFFVPSQFIYLSDESSTLILRSQTCVIYNIDTLYLYSSYRVQVHDWFSFFSHCSFTSAITLAPSCLDLRVVGFAALTLCIGVTFWVTDVLQHFHLICLASFVPRRFLHNADIWWIFMVHADPFSCCLVSSTVLGTL